MTQSQKQFRVFATCDIGEAALNRLRERGYDLEVYDQIEAPPSNLILEKLRSGIDGLVTTLRDRIDREVFEAGKGTLKVIAQDSVGFDNIDRASANEFKIPFTNTPDVLTEATAEFAFFMMGALARKLYSSERLVRENRWGTWHPSLPFLGDEVSGKTIGVIGMGRIGRAFIRMSLGFDVDILANSPSGSGQEFAEGIQEVLDVQHRHGFGSRRRTIRMASLEQVLAGSDFVALHVPLVREGPNPTYHLINEKTLRLMKPTAFLINTSRGPVVDEAALARALKDRVIAGAALDVFEKEPLPADSPLRDPALEDRVRLFHHFASAAQETRLSPDPNRGMAGRCVEALITVLESGRSPAEIPFVVNKEAFQ